MQVAYQNVRGWKRYQNRIRLWKLSDQVLRWFTWGKACEIISSKDTMNEPINYYHHAKAIESVILYVKKQQSSITEYYKTDSVQLTADSIVQDPPPPARFHHQWIHSAPICYLKVDHETVFMAAFPSYKSNVLYLLLTQRALCLVIARVFQTK